MAQGTTASKAARNVHPEDHEKGLDYAANLAKSGWKDEAIVKQARRFSAKGKADFAEGMTHYVLRMKAKASEPVVLGGPEIEAMEGFELSTPTAVQYRCIGPRDAKHIADVVIDDRLKAQIPGLEARVVAIIIEMANSELEFGSGDVESAIDAEIDELLMRVSKPPDLVSQSDAIVAKMSTEPAYQESYKPSIRQGRVLIQSYDESDKYRFFCPGVQKDAPASKDPRDIINWIFLTHHAKPEADEFLEYMQKMKAPDNYGQWGDEDGLAEVIEGFWGDRWQPDVSEVAEDLVKQGVFLWGVAVDGTKPGLLLPEADPISHVLVPRTGQALASFYDRKALDWLTGKQKWGGPDAYDTVQDYSDDVFVSKYRELAAQNLKQIPGGSGWARNRVFILDNDAFYKLTELEGQAWAARENKDRAEPNTFFDSLEGFKILIDEGLAGKMMKDPATGRTRPVLIGDITGSAGFIGGHDEIYIITESGEIVLLADTLPRADAHVKASGYVRLVGELPKDSPRKSPRKSSKKPTSRKSPRKSRKNLSPVVIGHMGVDGKPYTTAFDDLAEAKEALGKYPEGSVIVAKHKASQVKKALSYIGTIQNQNEKNYTQAQLKFVTEAGPEPKPATYGVKPGRAGTIQQVLRAMGFGLIEEVPRKPELPDWTAGVQPEGAYSSTKSHQMAADFIDLVHTTTMRNPTRRAYLYFRPSTEKKWGELLISGYDTPPGATVVTPEHVPTNKSKDQLAAWLRPILSHLPLLPTGDR